MSRPRARLLLASLFPLAAGATAEPPAAAFYTVPPCRLVDTRQAPAPLGGPALPAGATRVFPVGLCQVPSSAVAIAVNVTVVTPEASGHLRLFASGTPLPATSTLNYAAGQTRANNAIVPLGGDLLFAVHAHQSHGSVHLVVDVAGYFAASDCSSPPARPALTFDGGARTLSWPEVSGAASYDLYVRVEPGQCGLLHGIAVTRSDQKVPGVVSPVDVSPFNQCGACYFVDVVARSGDCESPLMSDLGLPAPLAFSLLPCVP